LSKANLLEIIPISTQQTLNTAVGIRQVVVSPVFAARSITLDPFHSTRSSVVAERSFSAYVCTLLHWDSIPGTEVARLDSRFETADAGLHGHFGGHRLT
jgi:hypothetical protein